ncbi:putative type IX secretion system sortase PorU2 [Spirosoma aerophilum]
MRPLRTRLFPLLLILLPLAGLAQSAGSDPNPTQWINDGQTYYKIPVAGNGLYRMTISDLRNARIPVDQLDPTTLQLFHRGIEQAIHVAGEQDGRFDNEDFLEFYGRGNDGVSDSLLYRPASAQPHPYYSLFSDTTTYFLTWRLDGKSGKRMVEHADTSVANLLPEPYHWAEDLRVFTTDYPGWPGGIHPKIEYSYFETGEGYTGSIQQKDKPLTLSFSLKNAVRTGPPPQLDLLLAGRDYTNHHVYCLVGPTPASQRLLDSVRFSTYDNAKIQQPVSWADIGPDGNVYVTLVSRGEEISVDAYSLSYCKLRYPQVFLSSSQQLTYTLAPNTRGQSLLKIAKVPNDTRFWDITNPGNPVQIRPHIQSDTVQLLIRSTETVRVIHSTNQPKSITAIQPVTFTNWSRRKPTYLIVTHEALMQPVNDPVTGSWVNAVQAYAGYRASAAGGSHDTLTATMQQLIDQYNYGERSPLAIRRFVAQLARQSNGSLRYLLLLGRARSTPGIRRNPNQATLDMVMTAGFPGSDVAYTSGLNQVENKGLPDDVPAIPTGRINAGTPLEVVNYLNKVKEYEGQFDNLFWHKNLLMLSGGQSPGERDLFKRLVESYQKQAVGESLGARVTLLSKKTDNPVEPVDVVKPVNEGVGLITFFGHSGLDVTDVEIGFSSNDALGYRNKGKYPILLINGCAIGNFLFGKPTLATDWVLTPERGAIAAIASSHLGQPDVMHRYTTAFFSLLTDSTQLNKSIGQLQQETIRRVLERTTNGRELANGQQMILQGDPAIRLFPVKTPDYGLTSGDLTIQSADQQPLTILSDSVQIRAVVYNAGQYRSGPLPIRVRRWVNDHESGVFNLLIPHSVAYRDTLSLTFPNERTAEGINRFEVTINPADLPFSCTETNRTNNLVSVEMAIPGSAPVLIYPPVNAEIRTTTVQLTAHYPDSRSRLFELQLDSTTHFTSPFLLSRRLTATGVISQTVTLSKQANVAYYWRVRLVKASGETTPNDSAGWSYGSFRYVPGSTTTHLPEGQLWLKTAIPNDIRQGDSVLIQAQFTNLSPYAFTDSLVVRQTLYAAGLPNSSTLIWKIKAPLRQDTLQLTTRIDTKNIPGTNRILLTVNPRLQPESSFVNNTLDLSLPVQPDRLGPLLEVAIDGKQIMDSAIVSARPMIDILLADDNRSLIRRDTVGLDLFLQRPSPKAAFARLSWRGAIIQPTGSDNIFRLRYPFSSLTDGVYQLLVTARDAVGNAAIPYRVSFRVVRERRLTNLTLYPNPFQNLTIISFQLTGDQPPGQAFLTFTNLTGQVVRQLNGSPRVGLNEWAWDGLDNDGHPLPAGTYLYRLTLQPAYGDDWPIRASDKRSGRILLIR